MEVREFGHHPAVTCRRDMTLGKVAELMRRNNVGSVVVMDEHGRMAGIATDRDIVLRGLGEGLDADDPIERVATKDVSYVYEHDDVFNAATRMATLGFRRVPVLDVHGIVLGMVTLDDLLVLFGSQIDKLVRAVRKEIAHDALPA